MPASNERRVRVEGFWKISATLLPASAREPSGSRLQLDRAVDQREQLVAAQLFAGEEVARQAGKCTVLRWRCAW